MDPADGLPSLPADWNGMPGVLDLHVVPRSVRGTAVKLLRRSAPH